MEVGRSRPARFCLSPVPEGPAAVVPEEGDVPLPAVAAVFAAADAAEADGAARLDLAARDPLPVRPRHEGLLVGPAEAHLDDVAVAVRDGRGGLDVAAGVDDHLVEVVDLLIGELRDRLLGPGLVVVGPQEAVLVARQRLLVGADALVGLLRAGGGQCADDGEDGEELQEARDVHGVSPCL